MSNSKQTNVVADSSTSIVEGLLGLKLLKKKVIVNTKDVLKEKDLILLYFSASWCPPCQAFSPILKDFYGIVNNTEKIEIIYISSDRTIDEFNIYYDKMPWLSLPMDKDSTEIKRNLANTLRITGIPVLIVLDKKTGNFITNDGRSDVEKASGNVAKYMDVIKKWKTTTPIPIDEALPMVSLFSLKSMVMSVLKNPMYLFGMLYFIKAGLRILKQYRGDTTADTNTAGLAIIQDEPIPDDEF